MNHARDEEYSPLFGPLYHYTSLDALLGIVEHKTLRATNVYYLNDASECDLGLGLIRQVAAEARESATDKKFLDDFIWWLDNRYIFDVGAVYVVCLSQARNHLGQWRGYTPHGRGVCIGIDVGILVERMQASGGGWTFQNCRYKKSSQRAFAQAIVTRMQRQATENPAPLERSDHYRSVIMANASEIMQLAAIMKNEAFAEEKEVRFLSPVIRNDDSRLRFRVGKSALIPYIDFKLVEDVGQSLESVHLWIGPSPTQQLTHTAVVALVERFKFTSEVNYHSTGIPYREL